MQAHHVIRNRTSINRGAVGPGGQSACDGLAVACSAASQGAPLFPESLVDFQDGVSALKESKSFFPLRIGIGGIDQVRIHPEIEIQRFGIHQDSIGSGRAGERPSSAERAKLDIFLLRLGDESLNRLGGCVVPVKALALKWIPKVIEVAKRLLIDQVFVFPACSSGVFESRFLVAIIAHVASSDLSLESGIGVSACGSRPLPRGVWSIAIPL